MFYTYKKARLSHTLLFCTIRYNVRLFKLYNTIFLKLKLSGPLDHCIYFSMKIYWGALGLPGKCFISKIYFGRVRTNRIYFLNNLY